MNGINLDKLIEKNYGKIGEPKRDQIEQELRIELIREEIKKLRKEKNLTQEELGRMIGVQRSLISKLENNAKNVTIGTLMKVFNALNAQINFSIVKRLA